MELETSLGTLLVMAYWSFPDQSAIDLDVPEDLYLCWMWIHLVLEEIETLMILCNGYEIDNCVLQVQLGNKISEHCRRFLVTIPRVTISLVDTNHEQLNDNN